jgi:hypothetical protein
MRVLEPNADVRVLFVRLIRRLGHEAVAGAEAKVSMSSCSSRPPPTRAAPSPRCVRARNPNVYVICASVYPAEEASIEADAFLVKPVSLAALRSALPSGKH